MRNFQDDEFECCEQVVYCKMDYLFLVLLDALRDAVGEPLVLNSSWRSVMHNDEVDGAKDSQHLYGNAVDIHCDNGALRLKIIREAIALGLSVGVYKNWIHVDNRDVQLIYVG